MSRVSPGPSRRATQGNDLLPDTPSASGTPTAKNQREFEAATGPQSEPRDPAQAQAQAHSHPEAGLGAGSGPGSKAGVEPPESPPAVSGSVKSDWGTAGVSTLADWLRNNPQELEGSGEGSESVLGEVPPTGTRGLSQGVTAKTPLNLAWHRQKDLLGGAGGGEDSGPDARLDAGNSSGPSEGGGPHGGEFKAA